MRKHWATEEMQQYFDRVELAVSKDRPEEAGFFTVVLERHAEVSNEGNNAHAVLVSNLATPDLIEALEKGLVVAREKLKQEGLKEMLQLFAEKGLTTTRGR